MTAYVPHSSHWGSFDALLDGKGKLDFRPSARDPAPSPLLGSFADIAQDRTRIRTPLVRTAYLRGDREAARASRGSKDFTAVSWDEALSLVADELSRVRSAYGNQSIFGGSYGWSSAGRFHHARTQLHRFLNGFGGFTGQEQNYSYAAAITFLPHILGSYQAIQGPVSSLDGISDHCRLMLCFGGVSPGNMQVEAGGMGAHSGFHWLKTCVERGMRIVSISPVNHELPYGIDLEWIQIRPNTDTAMLLGMAHVLLEEERADLAFLSRYCAGSEKAVAYIRGETDGVRKTPFWAENICGVPAATIAELAREMVRQRSFLTLSWSLQRADHGEQPLWAAITLASLVGQIGLPGGGFAFGLWSINGLGNPRHPISSPALSAGRNPISNHIPVARISDLLLNPGQEYAFNGETRRYADIRMVYWCGGNPFHHHQDINRLVRAFRQPETVIVQDCQFTATACHADIVLPATTTLERNDIGSSGRDRSITAMKKVMPAFADARDDFETFSELAERLDFAPVFTEGRNEMAWLRHIYDVSRAGAASRGIELPPFDDFWTAGKVEIPAPERPFTMFEDFRNDPQGKPLATPSGRIELHSETIASFGYEDCPGHAVWLEPSEWLGARNLRAGMLHMLSIQPATRLHSQLDSGRVSAESKVAGREPCWINPADAAERGINHGDVLELSNNRGRILAGAFVTNRVMRGVVVVATGAWYDPENSKEIGSLDKHGNPNVLTRDIGSSHLTQAPISQTVLVHVARYDGVAPPVTAHDGPPV